MKLPPIQLRSFDLRRNVYLLGFVEHETLYPGRPTEDHFFLCIYCLPRKVGASHYVILVNEDGTKQRRFLKAGESFEYALLVASGAFQVTPQDIFDIETFAPSAIFKGRLSIEMASYRATLKAVRKRLERLKMDFWAAAHSHDR